jgi:hypothetical protein
MPNSGIAFVRSSPPPDDACLAKATSERENHHVHRENCRNAGFAIAAAAIVFALGFTIEYQPVINALAH